MSLPGSLIGFVLPLASAITHSVNPCIPEGEIGAGVFLGAVSLAAGILNAACLTY